MYSNCSTFMYTFGAVLYVIALIRNANITEDNTRASVRQMNYRKTFSAAEYNSTGVILFIKYFQTSVRCTVVCSFSSNFITPY